jgi:hypothetical protein
MIGMFAHRFDRAVRTREKYKVSKLIKESAMLKCIFLLLGLSFMSLPVFAQSSDNQEQPPLHQVEEQKEIQKQEDSDRRKEKDEEYGKRLENDESDGPNGVGINGNSDASLHMSH